MSIAEDSPEPTGARAWEYQETCLIIAPDLSLDEWSGLWSVVAQTQRSANWWLGDALCYAQARYPETWTQILSERGVDIYKTAMWVCGKISPDRRRPELSYSAHREIAGLKSTETQDRWLSLAAEGNWSVAKLKEELKAEQERATSSASTYPSNQPANGSDSTWNPPPPEPDEEDDTPPSDGEIEFIRGLIDQVRRLPDLPISDRSALESRLAGFFRKRWAGEPLLKTDDALRIRPSGWRIEMSETDKGWNVRLSKSGAQIAIGIGQSLPASIVEAALTAALSGR